MASASKIFSRVPPPARSGTTYTAPSAIDGRTSFTVPVTVTPPDARRGVTEPLGRIAADDGKRRVGNLRANRREDRVEEIQDGILVRMPVHRSAEDQMRGPLQRGHRREVVGVDASRNRRRVDPRRELFEATAIVGRDGNGQVGPPAGVGLPRAQLPPFDLQQGADPRPPLQLREPLPDLVLDVVLEEHHRRGAGAGDVHRREQEIGHDEVDAGGHQRLEPARGRPAPATSRDRRDSATARSGRRLLETGTAALG